MPSPNQVTNSCPYFYGDLVSGNFLISISKQRSKKNGPDGREKDADELLEDEVWTVFKNSGFIEMNRDRNFKIQAGSSPKQIDVYARDENNVFVIFCTTNSSINVKDEIRKISDIKRDISLSIEKYYNNKFRLSLILVTKNIKFTLDKTDEILASSKNIFLWSEDDLEAYKNLVEQLGHAAKYQMYALLFPDKETSEVGKLEVPAMRGGKGRNKYYCFLIQPDKLFKIAYVHRREKSNPKEVEKTYQRMINKKRLEKIGQFIDNGNSFPNNIILSFRKKPGFRPHPKVKEVSGISYGFLKFPAFYGCAWIIDGQHRLYGYSKSKHATDHTLPVIAYESLDVKEQANLFVDINQEQKSVNKSLLWDLYSDIYYGSEDENQQILRAISLAAKKLNFDRDSIFYKCIQIPSTSIKDAKDINLSLSNICDAIRENKLIDRGENVLFKENYDVTVDSTAKVIKAFFEVINTSLGDDWKKGRRGLLKTNVGISIFFIILRQVLRYFDHLGRGSIFRKNDLSEFKNEASKILEPALNKLKSMDQYKIDEIRQGTNNKVIKRNAQQLLWDLYQKTNFGAELWFKGGWTPGIPKEDTDEHIKKLIDDTETNLRYLIVQKLKEVHGESWWEKGIPSGASDYIKNEIQRDISKTPWKRDELLSLPNEKKLAFTSTAHLKEIIINSNNWNYFEKIFAKDKECVSVQFRFFENIRNKFKHPERDLDEIEKGLGYYGMRWIRRCVGIDTPRLNNDAN